jgi:dTDP-4-amino-4,6-dideoxygalactose transaminase
MTILNIKYNAFKTVSMFEEELAEYTGAPYAVAVDSCTNALFLSFMYYKLIKYGYLGVSGMLIPTITVPNRTYLSVPQSILHAGYDIRFKDFNWTGAYQLEPLPIWDSAKRLTSNMYIPGSYMCLSFHIKKTLPIGKGGAILTDNKEVVEWLKMARYEGRHEKNYKDDDIVFNGWNMYMSPESAARGLNLLMNYPKDVPDLGEPGDYRDLTEFTLFKDWK